MTRINQLESIKVFKAVVECGSFSAAAQRLNVSAAWVSKSIERLENQLNTTLFTRSTRHMQITDSGERCYTQGLALLKQWQSLQEDLSTSQESPKGKLRISVPMTWGLSELDRVLATFMNEYPEIQLDIQLSDQHVNVMEEEFDLVLRLTHQLADSALLCKKITSYQHIICAAPHYLNTHGIPNHPKKLVDHQCLMYRLPGTPRKWQFKEGNKALDVFLEPKVESNNSRLLHSMLLENHGIGLMLDFLVNDDISAGRLVPILQAFQPTPIGLYSLRPKDRRTSYRLKLLHDYLCLNLKRD